MTKKEWRKFIKQIYYDSLLSKLSKTRKHFHPFEFHESSHEYEQILRAMRTLRFIESNFQDNDELTKYFTPEYLKQILNAIESGLRLNERYLIDTGISEVIEKYFDEILAGIEIKDFPKADLTALRESGSVSPKSELQFSITRIKKERTFSYESKNKRFSYDIKYSKERITEQKEQISNSNDKDKPKKRIFKGLGNITRGSILTFVDVSLLMGAWTIPLSPETTSVGAVVSITTGIGDIMSGVGEFRGE